MECENCWEFMGCGREPGGKRAADLGVCPAAEETSFDGLNAGQNAGRLCWAVAGTFRGGEVRGVFARDISSCLGCDFFRAVRLEARPFLLMKPGQRYREGALGREPTSPGPARSPTIQRRTPLNCWEYFRCGRECGGRKVVDLGVCPAASHEPTDGLNRGTNAGRACWTIAGTFCFDEVQGSVAQKCPTCLACEFFSAVRSEEEAEFLLMRPGVVFETDEE